MINPKDIKPADLESIISGSFAAKTQDVSHIDVTKVVDLAVEVWRLKNRLKKYNLKITDDQSKLIDNSFERINRFFDACEIGIKDYTGSKYIDELNIDPISFETKPGLGQPMIIETLEPQISIRDKVFKKSKVIVGNPEEDTKHE